MNIRKQNSCIMDQNLNFVHVKKKVAIKEGDYYLTPEGYKVFTAQYLLKRGYCCKSGCRHCPYGYDKKTDSFKKK